MTTRRANYAVFSVLEYLAPSESALDVPWAEFAGNRSSPQEFTVPTDDATDVYVELQAYDVDAFGHEILLNGEPLTGFDIPPGDGWQYWMDRATETELLEGENTFRVERDADTKDAFAIGAVVVNWKEPVE